LTSDTITPFNEAELQKNSKMHHNFCPTSKYLAMVHQIASVHAEVSKARRQTRALTHNSQTKNIRKNVMSQNSTNFDYFICTNCSGAGKPSTGLPGALFSMYSSDCCHLQSNRFKSLPRYDFTAEDLKKEFSK